MREQERIRRLPVLQVRLIHHSVIELQSRRNQNSLDAAELGFVRCVCQEATRASLRRRDPLPQRRPMASSPRVFRQVGYVQRRDFDCLCASEEVSVVGPAIPRRSKTRESLSWPASPIQCLAVSRLRFPLCVRLFRTELPSHPPGIQPCTNRIFEEVERHKADQCGGNERDGGTTRNPFLVVAKRLLP
jgi:hypothetical protein